MAWLNNFQNFGSTFNWLLRVDVDLVRSTLSPTTSSLCLESYFFYFRLHRSVKYETMASMLEIRQFTYEVYHQVIFC